MKAQYIRAMDAIHAPACSWRALASSSSRVIIPYGVFSRYVLNSAASWPEPMAVLLMIVLSFLSAVVCYREYLHIGVGVLPAFLDEPAKTLSRLVPRSLHAGHQPVHAGVGHQARADHLVSEHPRVPDRVGRPGLSADPDRRRAHGPVRDRALHDAESSSPSPSPRPSASCRPNVEARAGPWTSSSSSAASPSSA